MYKIIGDFYGDPNTAFIDDDENYCAIGGCGLIIYYLNKPFAPYQYDKKSKQWVELFRQKEDLLWIENIYSPNSENELRIVVDLTDEIQKGVYKLDLQTLQLEKLL